MHMAHRHIHRRADFLNEVGDFIDGINPFSEIDNNEENRNSARDNGDNGKGQATVIRTIYKTMDPTFTEGIGGYTTVKKDSNAKATATHKNEAATTQKAKAKATASSDDDKKKDAESARTEVTSETRREAKTEAKKTSKAKTTALPTVIEAPTNTASLEGTVLALETEKPTVSPSVKLATSHKASSSAALASATSTDASSSNDAGSSAGAKAGIAFGVLGGLLIVGLLVFFAFNRRRRQTQRQRLGADDEKMHGQTAGASGYDAMSTRTTPTAPRVSLRPVTQLFSNWNFDKRASKGAAMSLTPAFAAAGPATNHGSGDNAWERPMTSQHTHLANPFGNQAERVPTPIIEETSMHTLSSPPSPRSEKSSISDSPTTTGPAGLGGLTAGAAAGAGAPALARQASMRKDGLKHLDLTLPALPTGPLPAGPAGTEFSGSAFSPGTAISESGSAAAIAAAGGPVNSSVHRVQLDFRPTLEDEMELRAGELVRLLHEYDDGWALCIRLDRSQQGVVPRTCLSTRPVKPRPAQGGPRPGPPINHNGPPQGANLPQGQRFKTPRGYNQGYPQARPASPAGRSMNPNGGRPQSPMGHPSGRPMSPGPRAQSPSPRQGPPGGRSQSPSGTNRRMSPPGPSLMNPEQSPRQGPPTGPVGRKPVPGQAY